MTNKERFSISDSTSAPENVFLGDCFAFFGRGALAGAGLGWIGELAGPKAVSEGHILALVGPHKFDILGLTIQPKRWNQLDLTSIVSDKSLYSADHDVINLLVIDPVAPNSSQAIQVLLNGQNFSREHVRLADNGEGQLVLRDLPVGEFEVCFDSRGPSSKSSCRFVVAEYRLVPLVVSLAKSEIKDENVLNVTLRVESFGTAVNGKLQIDLMDQYRRLETVKTTAVDGYAQATVKLKGAGPHSLNVQLEDDPSKTATVPLRGSREEERVKTFFSKLGTGIAVSLLPEAGSQAVRGLHLVETGLCTSPITLEQVADDRARLKVNKNVAGLKALVIDPTYPQVREDAIDPMIEKHPETYESRYAEAERLFKEGKFTACFGLFQQIRKESHNPHPYFAYWMACCLARQDRKPEAVSYLRLAIEDGWNEFTHMANDEDLAALKGYEPFEALKRGGMKQFAFEHLPAGAKIELDVFEPLSIVALGAFVDGHPWEGWATLMTPSAISLQNHVDSDYEAGAEVTLDFSIESEAKGARTSGSKSSSLYVVLKDARLLSTDTPESQLAGQLKAYVNGATAELNIGKPKEKLSEALSKLSLANSVRYRGGFEGSYGSAAGWGSPPPGMAFDQVASGGPPTALPSPASAGWGGSLGAVFGGAANTIRAMAAGVGSTGEAYAQFEMEATGRLEQGVALAKQFSEATEVAPRPTPLTAEQPQVLFAGFVELQDGKGKLTVSLPEYFNEYIVECFAISGMQWAYKESRFKASKDPFVHLTLPVFARADEETVATMQVSSSKEPVTVVLLRDGAEVELKKGAESYKSEKITGSVALQFNAAPGLYEAILKSDDREVDRVVQRIQEPGKLKRRVRSLQILEAGQSIGIADDTSIQALSFLPSLNSSFQLLTEATADYSHCCCEQTAAKIMSACAMYLFSNGDDSSRKRAESIILAGIRRESKMWLKGRGFKAYPEQPDEPNPYYGAKAARYLWNLELLRTAGGAGMSQSLKEAIDEGLEMAKDTSSAYKLSWPPQKFNTCEDAYAAVRHGDSNGGSIKQEAVEFAKKRSAAGKQAKPDPYLGTAVHNRVEDAYAAATLFRAGGPEAIRTAMKLTNNVVKDFNEQGRLYSTCDSVAAIALMSELVAARITSGGGSVEMNGRSFQLDDAMSSTEVVRAIKVLEGVATVAVDRIVEEDWSAYGADVEMTVKVERNGRHQTNLTTGDSVDLIVSLDKGYVDGDLLWVCLPDALSRVIGGGQVKLFSVDFSGKSEVTIPLAATGVTGGAGKLSQSMAVCVRNMFQEERTGSPGLIAVTVKQS